MFKQLQKQRFKWLKVEISFPKRKLRNSVIILDHLSNRWISLGRCSYVLHTGVMSKEKTHDMPDIPIPEDQFEKIEQKYVTAKNVTVVRVVNLKLDFRG